MATLLTERGSCFIENGQKSPFDGRRVVRGPNFPSYYFNQGGVDGRAGTVCGMVDEDPFSSWPPTRYALWVNWDDDKEPDVHHYYECHIAGDGVSSLRSGHIVFADDFVDDQKEEFFKELK